jgi:hypothetical protein
VFICTFICRYVNSLGEEQEGVATMFAATEARQQALPSSYIPSGLHSGKNAEDICPYFLGGNMNKVKIERKNL